MADLIPRSIPDPDPQERFWDQQKDTQKAVERQERGAPQRSQSVSDTTGAGIRSDAAGFRTVDSLGRTIAFLQVSDGTLVIFDPVTGSPRARFGKLLSDGSYGGEIWDPVNSAWVKLVTGSSVAWAAITGKPAAFPPTGHTHAGVDITSAVANAANASAAGSAAQAAQADGSAYAFNNTVAGSQYFAVWVGNDGGFHFGRNVSSLRYKENVRPYAVDPARVLALEPRVFDRKPTLRPPASVDGQPAEGPAQLIPGARDEYGLIAEEVNALLPEIAITIDGEIDGLRYDLLAVALLDVVKAQQAALDAHQARIAGLEETVHQLVAAVRQMGGTA
ncbi:tail fiber domain-containing protein [Sinomonas sp. P47F7]|uniref:tail fiber domain-containing protein n=1 Tax=Sinomonas sp. P47F7 TaxID=3410987 RepID=UPI003BF60F1E